MSTNQSEMRWHAIVTSLGTTVCRFKPQDFACHEVGAYNTPLQLVVHDACSCIQRPAELYISQFDLDKETPEPETFTFKEAKDMAFLDEANHELVQVEGPMEDDYVPMFPDDEDGTNTVRLRVDQVIFIKNLGERPELTQYVNRLLKRTQYKVVDNAEAIPQTAGICEGKE